MKKIIGYEKEIQVINELREMLSHSKTYRQKGVRLPKGLLLSGPPGVGKTVLSDHLIGDNISRLFFDTSVLCHENYSEEIQNVFIEAKTQQPCVIVIDEIDKIANSSDSFYMETNNNIQKLLLNLLDNINNEDDILVVGICNSMYELGKALLRPGRFDRQLIIPLPSLEERIAIFQYYIGNINIKQEINYDLIGKLTNGYSGAEIESLANEVGITAITRKSTKITTDNVYEIVKRQTLKSIKSDETDEETRYKTAVHESGHALLGLLLSPDNVFNVSIEPQGASFGNTCCFKTEKSNPSFSERKNDIMIALGGHIAERIVFNDYIVGSEKDLKTAYDILSYLVEKCGMCGYEFMSFSEMYRTEETTRLKICKELEILDRNAEMLIVENRDLFNCIVDKLLLHNSLSNDDLIKLKKESESNRSPVHNFNK